MAHPFQEKRKEYQAQRRKVLAHIRAGKRLQGFAIQQVKGQGDEPGYAYTIGLHDLGYPELLISGLSARTRAKWLLDLGFRMAGPPPLTRRLWIYGLTLWARLHGQPLPWPAFPKGGQTFQTGVRYADLAEGGLPTILVNVAAQHYRKKLGVALCYYGHCRFPVWQIVWPDIAGHFPWDERFHAQEQCLFDSRRLIVHLAGQGHPAQDTHSANADGAQPPPSVHERKE